MATPPAFPTVAQVLSCSRSLSLSLSRLLSLPSPFFFSLLCDLSWEHFVQARQPSSPASQTACQSAYLALLSSLLHQRWVWDRREGERKETGMGWYASHKGVNYLCVTLIMRRGMRGQGTAACPHRVSLPNGTLLPILVLDFWLTGAQK